MATIVREFELGAPAGAVWDVFRNVGSVHRRLARGFVVATEVSGGERVVTFSNGVVARERIVAIDDERRRLAYTIVGGRAAHHHASFQVLGDGDARSRVLWTTDLLPDEAAPAFAQMIDRGIEAIRSTIEADERERAAHRAG